ncbi:PrpF domain-containing protein [Corynebacterium lubricantis]|uniref:PrpF domain-containing protein n=1 Tax=Corynebacterium lubricantis TaxID=541095 RepID=UPI0005245809|nr:PrpF domain-containing protein [Corynebacterium lubricantis]
MTASYPCHIMRGGTSRGLLLRLQDLPEEQSLRDELCLRLIGSPDPVAFDGLGGGVSSNSKVMFVGPAEESDEADVVSLFAQVSPTEALVDWNGNCGNLSSAILPYAIDTGLIPAQESCLVRNLNTGTLMEITATHTRFVRPGGEKTGAIFPAGRITQIQGVDTTLIDVANPIAIVRARDLGVELTTREDMNADQALLDRLESFRIEAGARMGLNSKVIPRLALSDGNRVFMTSVGVIHHALPATGILALGAAAALGGTVFEGGMTFSHPKGDVTVEASVNGDELKWVALERTARIIMRGEVFV